MSKSFSAKTSRRDMLLASGILLTSMTQRSSATAPAEEEKDLIFRTTQPRNAEPELDKLIQSWITPTKHFYVRSHAPNPIIDESKFRLQIGGMVERDVELSMDEIRSLPQQTITATLTCAGNRREEYNREGKIGGVQWDAGAIGNATWTGVRLGDVLDKAGIKESVQHVWFEGLDEIEKGAGTIPFGASIPIDKALGEGKDPGAMLAFAMNGQKLTADHGFPLRGLVPGYIGARSVKWLGRITLSDRTSPNHYLATAYKLVRDTDSIDWAEAGPIYKYLINAAIGSIPKHAEVKPGKLTVSGYVLPSGVSGARVRRVMVSTDSGSNWTEASLTGDDQDFCWQLWQAEIEVANDTTELIVRAIDNEGGFMPPRVPWNAKGYLQNSWYRLPVKVL